ncbi:MAG: class I SAM-dependent methyltransferase [Prosthecobacter sp.]|uniref:class I SAM-dependent methyltransferase n=1 Tax=Prosthecobacter sp. TaxID=1965333 RepID=UPI0019F4C97B|nr:class I SAM-dependent methyltransferase [Prosthecobacter sp.]MBE2286405.1 class I SAM-dependent methyltransferase [Prosthecobacter sp.]
MNIATPLSLMIRRLVRNFLRTLMKGRDVLRHRKELATFLNFRNRTQPGFEGSVQPEELEFLSELVRRSNAFDGPIIEVGTLFGFTTQAMAGWKMNGKELISIDDYSWNPLGLAPLAHRDFAVRSLHYIRQNCDVTLFEGPSTQFCASYDGPTPAMIFIDASHEYEHVLTDITWARQKGVPIIAGHDYSAFWPGVKRAVDESFGSAITVYGTLWAHVNQGAS